MRHVGKRCGRNDAGGRSMIAPTGGYWGLLRRCGCGADYGNSLSLSAAPSRGSLVRIVSMESGNFIGRRDFCLGALPRQYDPKAPSRPRLRRRRAGSRRRRETEGVARGRSAADHRRRPPSCRTASCLPPQCSRSVARNPKKISHPKPTSPSAFPQSFPKEGLQNVSGPRCR